MLLVLNTCLFFKSFLQMNPFVFSDMINHLIISYGKQIRLRLLCFYLVSVFPEFFKTGLYNIPGVFFMPKIFHDKPEKAIGMVIYAFIVLKLSHRDRNS